MELSEKSMFLLPLFLVLLQEEWNWGEENIASFCFGVIKATRKRGDLKISLSNPRGGKILRSTTSGNKSKGDKEEGCRDVLNVGAW